MRKINSVKTGYNNRLQGLWVNWKGILRTKAGKKDSLLRDSL